MCQHLTILAKYSEHQWIAQCEHGTLHLTWQRTIISLRLSECKRLAVFLDAWAPESRDGMKLMRDDAFRLFQDPTGRVQFWLYDTGLQLATHDVPVLRKLVQIAARQAEPQEPRDAAPITDKLETSCELSQMHEGRFSPN
jgi:hypothetical protein